MSNTDRKDKALAGMLAGFMVALTLAVLALAIAATGVSAAPAFDKPPVVPADTATSTAEVTGTSEPTATATARPTHTPRPIKLRPVIQFGHAGPGGNAHYVQLLINHLNDSEQVDVSGGSVRGWNVSVVPTVATTLPGYANVISVTVHVPLDPDHWVDIERTRGVLSNTNPYTTTAYMITITRRHPWTDLEEGNWADDPVQFLLDQGVIGGYPDGSFRPNDLVTRAQFSKMLVTAMQWPIQTPATPSFNDVSADFWAYGYIETAVAHGVISGYPDGSFRPGNGVTRAQAAKMIFLARGWTLEDAATTNFADVGPGDWFYSYAQAAASAGVVNGYQDNTFRPNIPATRGQIAKILALSLFSDPSQ